MNIRCIVSGRDFNLHNLEIEIMQRSSKLIPWCNTQIHKLNKYPSVFIREIFSYGNLINLYKSKSNLSNDFQLSRFNPEFSFKIATPTEFFGDLVENKKFGLDYNSNISFFDQFNNLLKNSYLLPMVAINQENSDYVNGAANIKNCYLSFAIINSEDCLYCLAVNNCKDCLDCIYCNYCQFCYMCIDCNNCYECKYSQNIDNCSDCIACLGCNNSINCIGCVGLSYASFCIFNKQYSELEFKQIKNRLNLSSFKDRESFLIQFEKFISNSNYIHNSILNSEDSSGAYITNSKNCYHSYNVSQMQDSIYLAGGIKSENCMFCVPYNSTNCTFGTFINSSNSHFCYHCYDSHNIMYSIAMYNNCYDCFGCVGLKKSNYCILNKQYSKSDYHFLVNKIINDMKSRGEFGEFFPIKNSLHSYEESCVSLYQEDISEDEIIRRGFKSHKNISDIQSRDFIKPPDDIINYDINLLTNKTIECVESKQGFNLQHKELVFYQKNSIPIPRMHWKNRIYKYCNKRIRFPELIS